MAVSQSVASLRSFSRQYKAELMESLVATPKSCHRLEKFLNLRIIPGNKDFQKNYYKVKEYKNPKYRQRVVDVNGCYTPTWEMYAEPDDKCRSRSEHLDAIRYMSANAQPLSSYDNSQPIDNNRPDPKALTAILNIIHSINPNVEFTQPDGNPLQERGRSYNRKTTGRFIRLQTGKAC